MLEVADARDALAKLELGFSSRRTGSTTMNEHSSRSHAIISAHVHGVLHAAPGAAHTTLSAPALTERRAVLDIVDLAGSEQQKKTHADGERLREATAINASLSALSNVVTSLSITARAPNAAAERPRWRDSKLTLLLKRSLGGNCLTTIIATLSPAAEHWGESQSTLDFVARARHMKTRPVQNQVESSSGGGAGGGGEAAAATIRHLQLMNEQLALQLAEAQAAAGGVGTPTLDTVAAAAAAAAATTAAATQHTALAEQCTLGALRVERWGREAAARLPSSTSLSSSSSLATATAFGATGGGGGDGSPAVQDVIAQLMATATSLMGELAAARQWQPIAEAYELQLSAQSHLAALLSVQREGGGEEGASYGALLAGEADASVGSKRGRAVVWGAAETSSAPPSDPSKRQRRDNGDNSNLEDTHEFAHRPLEQSASTPDNYSHHHHHPTSHNDTFDSGVDGGAPAAADERLDDDDDEDDEDDCSDQDDASAAVPFDITAPTPKISTPLLRRRAEEVIRARQSRAAGSMAPRAVPFRQPSSSGSMQGGGYNTLVGVPAAGSEAPLPSAAVIIPFAAHPVAVVSSSSASSPLTAGTAWVPPAVVSAAVGAYRSAAAHAAHTVALQRAVADCAASTRTQYEGMLADMNGYATSVETDNLAMGGRLEELRSALEASQARGIAAALAGAALVAELADLRLPGLLREAAAALTASSTAAASSASVLVVERGENARLRAVLAATELQLASLLSTRAAATSAAVPSCAEMGTVTSITAAAAVPTVEEEEAASVSAVLDAAAAAILARAAAATAAAAAAAASAASTAALPAVPVVLPRGALTERVGTSLAGSVGGPAAAAALSTTRTPGGSGGEAGTAGVALSSAWKVQRFSHIGGGGGTLASGQLLPGSSRKWAASATLDDDNDDDNVEEVDDVCEEDVGRRGEEGDNDAAVGSGHHPLAPAPSSSARGSLVISADHLTSSEGGTSSALHSPPLVMLLPRPCMDPLRQMGAAGGGQLQSHAEGEEGEGTADEMDEDDGDAAAVAANEFRERLADILDAPSSAPSSSSSSFSSSASVAEGEGAGPLARPPRRLNPAFANAFGRYNGCAIAEEPARVAEGEAASAASAPPTPKRAPVAPEMDAPLPSSFGTTAATAGCEAVVGGPSRVAPSTLQRAASARDLRTAAGVHALLQQNVDGGAPLTVATHSKPAPLRRSLSDSLVVLSAADSAAAVASSGALQTGESSFTSCSDVSSTAPRAVGGGDSQREGGVFGGRTPSAAPRPPVQRSTASSSSFTGFTAGNGAGGGPSAPGATATYPSLGLGAGGGVAATPSSSFRARGLVMQLAGPVVAGPPSLLLPAAVAFTVPPTLTAAVEGGGELPKQQQRLAPPPLSRTLSQSSMVANGKGGARGGGALAALVQRSSTTAIPSSSTAAATTTAVATVCGTAGGGGKTTGELYVAAAPLEAAVPQAAKGGAPSFSFASAVTTAVGVGAAVSVLRSPLRMLGQLQRGAVAGESVSVSQLQQSSSVVACAADTSRGVGVPPAALPAAAASVESAAAAATVPPVKNARLRALFGV